jgi:hypothetical protein
MTRKRPILGWASITLAGLLVLFFASIFLMTLPHEPYSPSGGGSIGASAGAINFPAIVALFALVGLGFLTAVVGAIRGERPLWIHGVGALLALATPVLAIVVVRSWLS